MTGWLQCAEPFPGNQSVFEIFEALFMANRAPKRCALFSRESTDLREHIFLLTPDAAKWAPMMPGHWTDAGNPQDHIWTGLIFEGDAHVSFGLKPPSR